MNKYKYQIQIFNVSLTLPYPIMQLLILERVKESIYDILYV